MDQLYGMFKGPQTDGMPGVLTLDGTATRLVLWRQNRSLVHDFPKRVFGRFHNMRKMTLWGLHDAFPVPDNLLHPWQRNGVEAVAATPMYGVTGPCEFDPDAGGTHVAAIVLCSPHLELDMTGHDPAAPAETPYGMLSATMDTDWSHPRQPLPIAKIRLEFPDPVPFALEGQRRMGALLFLCEALTGRSHNADGAEFEVPLAEAPYRLHDFLTAGARIFPCFEAEKSTARPHVTATECLAVGAAWLDRFLAPDSVYPEIFSHLSESLGRQYRYDRLRVFQSVNVFDLFPVGGLANALGQRIRLVAKEIDGLGLHPNLPFTGANLRKFKHWGVAMRNRVVHGRRITKGKDKGALRPTYCDDPAAWGYVCNTLEFVLALSTLIECGFQFRWLLDRSQVHGRNKFRDVAFALGRMVEYLEGLDKPADGADRP